MASTLPFGSGKPTTLATRPEDGSVEMRRIIIHDAARSSASTCINLRVALRHLYVILMTRSAGAQALHSYENLGCRMAHMGLSPNWMHLGYAAGPWRGN